MLFLVVVSSSERYEIPEQLRQKNRVNINAAFDSL